MVLACAAGHNNQTVARRLRLSPATVGKWRVRFARDRVDGLLDEPRPGAPRTVTDDQVEQVVITTLEATPPGATHWSTRSLARTTGLSLRAVFELGVVRRRFDHQAEGAEGFVSVPRGWSTIPIGADGLVRAPVDGLQRPAGQERVNRV